MPKKKTDPGADYRAAKAALSDHLKAWADAEQVKIQWLKAKRGVPSHLLYDRRTGAPLDPELAELEAAEAAARDRYGWCKALVVACGEVVKGQSFDEVLAAQGGRPSVDEVLTKVEG